MGIELIRQMLREALHNQTPSLSFPHDGRSIGGASIKRRRLKGDEKLVNTTSRGTHDVSFLKILKTMVAPDIKNT